jgi:hypothetical protein
MNNQEFRNFVINRTSSSKRSRNKGLTMPSKEDYSRMAAHRIIEQRREDKELERLYDLNCY